MTAVGIDFGNRYCTIAVAQRNGIDVLLNEVSTRQNSTMVSFGDKERQIGESAATQHLRNLQNTITDVKLVLGRQPDEKDVIKELSALPLRWSAQDNTIVFDVFSRGESKRFTPVQITSMILHRLKEITEKALDKPVKEVVVSVPGWWNDAQRRAMMDAIQVSGWSCVKIANEHAAVATLYGLYKANPKEGETQNVMFCDMGHSSTTVSIVEFTPGKAKILSTSYDRGLGGKNFDKLLADHFAAIFKTKYKIDIKTNKKATIRLEQACERLKKMFTTNPDATMSVESIMNDIDVKGDMKRPEFDTMVAPLIKRFLKTVQRALDDAKLTSDKLFSVEIVGGSMRMLALQSALAEYLKKEISKTLNPEEAVAKGCALQCASLTPYFKVKEIAVADIYPYPVRVSWKNLSSKDPVPVEDTADVISKGEPLPSKIKLLSFSRSEPFELVAEYKMDECVQPQVADDEPVWGLDPKIQPLIARCVVPQLTGQGQTAPSELPASIRAKAKLTISGTFVFDGVQLLETIPETETPAENKDAKPEVKADAKDAKTEPMDATPTSPSANTADQSEESKKKKVRRVELSYNESNASLPVKIVQSFTEEEGKMQADDRLLTETAEKKCALESLIYDIRDKIKGSEYGSFATDADKSKLEGIMDKSLSWLYDEGADATKSVYQQKIDEIQAISNPMVARKQEAENRHHAVTTLRSLIEQHKSFAVSNDPKYEHITQEERNTVLKACTDVESFINTKMQEQEKRPKVENPIITVAQINQKKADLEKICNPIISKPKPQPKPEPKPAEQKPAEQKPAEQKPAEQKPAEQKQENGEKPNGTTPDVKMAEPTEPSKTPEKAKTKEMDLD